MAYQLEYPELANALYLALKPDGFYQAMEASVDGDETTKKNAMLAYMDYSILEAQEFGECYIPKQQHYGVSIWSYPLPDEQSQHKSQQKKDFIENIMGQASYQAYYSMCEFMSRHSTPIVSSSAWYLSIIGILPDFQGQGLGPGLVENVLEKTDKLGISTYLETFTPRNITFYQRLGYESEGSFIEPTANAEYWLLSRPPSVQQ